MDPDDGDELIGGADLEMFEWYHDSNANMPWPSAGSSSYPTVDNSVVTSSVGLEDYEDDHPYDRDFNWAFKDYSGDCPNVDGLEQENIQAAEREDMFRFRIDKEGYRPSFYYEYFPEGERREVYDCGDNEWQDPYVTLTFDDFELWPENPDHDDHLLLPDIMPDPRDLESYEFDCAQIDSEKTGSVTMRSDASWANVGYGDFEIEHTETSDEMLDTFRQVVHRNDGGTIRRNFGTDMMEWHGAPGHNHYHMQDWSMLRLLEDTASCKDYPSERSTDCEIVAEGHKLGACVMSTDLFDAEIDSEYKESNLFQSCYPGLRMGLNPGWKDVYHKGLEGQGIHLGNPAGRGNIVEEGTYLLENHWDPTGFYEEEGEFRERNNTAVRVEVEVPSFSTADPLLQDSCDSETDYRHWQNLDPPEQNRCRDHLRCEENSDCDIFQTNFECLPAPDEADNFCQEP